MPESLKVFVSSTYKDLAAHRAVVHEVIDDLNWTFVGMEHFGTDPEWTLSSCRRRVGECDVVVLLQAWWEGWAPRRKRVATAGPRSPRSS